MTKLITTYARITGLQIEGEPNVKEHFYPSPFERYITIQTGSGQTAKNYDLFPEVLALLKDRLDDAKIAIVHLGAKDDPALPGVYDLRGKTTIQQSNFLMRRTLLHLGGDSWLAHCAGWQYRPLVALYGSTSVKNHGPFWYSVKDTVLIESHRWGGVPSYTSQEPVKTINLIPPEEVANAVVWLLNLGAPFTRQSRLFGPLYPHLILDLVPNTFPAPSFLPEAPITVRMDVLFNEEVLVNLLRTGRKVNLMTKQPVSLDVLQTFRQQILSYNHEVALDNEAACPISYVEQVKTLVPRHVFFTRETDSIKVSALRFRYFGYCVVEQLKDASKQDYLDSALHYLNADKDEKRKLDIEGELRQDWGGGTLCFKTNRFILSEGRVFLSYAHLRKGLSVESLANNSAPFIDEPDSFRDLGHFYLYYQPCQQPQTPPQLNPPLSSATNAA